jgi:hypothetical protein
MPPPESEDLIAAWLEYQRNWWAFGALQDLCASDPEAAWPILLRIVSLAENDELLESIGAGPLEDLLQAHGHTLVARLEAEAPTNPKLQKALASAWLPRAEDSTTLRLVALGCDLLREAPESMRLPIAMVKEGLRLAEERHNERDDA